MRNYPSQQIAIRMTFEDIGDGRTYVTSPDLRGFHAVIESDDDPTQALQEPLRLFLSHYLDADIAGIGVAETPVSHRARAVGIPLAEHQRPELLFAEVG